MIRWVRPWRNAITLTAARYTKRPFDSASRIDKYVGPFKVVGTQKPKSMRFFSWNLNVSAFRDILSPTMLLTFEDTQGKIVGPICYRANIVTWGLKVEVGPRFGVCWFSAPECGHIFFDSIPMTFDVISGYDGGLAVCGVGGIFSRYKLSSPELSTGMYLNSVAVGNAIGFTRIGNRNRLSAKLLHHPFFTSFFWEDWEKLYAWHSVILYGAVLACVLGGMDMKYILIPKITIEYRREW